LEALVGLAQRTVEVGCLDAARLLVRGTAFGSSQRTLAVARWPDAPGLARTAYKRRHRVSRTDLAAVHRVVAEVVVGDFAVVVADEPEPLDGRRVEGDLRLGVAGPQFDLGGELFAEDLAGVVVVRHVRGVASPLSASRSIRASP